ncbi:MAG: glycosyltransferase family 4 protein [Candidatus Woesearchaeota archaeon]
MKILVLNYEFPPLGGGAGQVTYELSKNLVKLGHEVDLITMHFNGLKEHEIVEGINVFRVKCIRKNKTHTNIFEMLSYLFSSFFFLKNNKKKYDVIHCHFIIPTGILAYLIHKIYKIPYIITIHGSDVPGFNQDRFVFAHKFTIPILRLIIQNSRYVISPSNYLANLARKNIGNYNIQVIPNGINLDRLGNKKFSKKNFITTSARLFPRKGIQYVLEALSKDDFKKFAMSWEYHILGDGPYKNELLEKAKKSKIKVFFHGWLNPGTIEYQKILKQSKIFILTSKNENASISLLEAMLAKCAIITSNSSGCKETIGNTGFLVDPEDVIKIKDLLIFLMSNPKILNKKALQAYRRLIKNYLWRDISKKYEKYLLKSI